MAKKTPSSRVRRHRRRRLHGARKRGPGQAYRSSTIDSFTLMRRTRSMLQEMRFDCSAMKPSSVRVSRPRACRRRSARRAACRGAIGSVAWPPAGPLGCWPVTMCTKRRPVAELMKSKNWPGQEGVTDRRAAWMASVGPTGRRRRRRRHPGPDIEAALRKDDRDRRRSRCSIIAARKFMPSAVLQGRIGGRRSRSARRGVAGAASRRPVAK